MEAAIAIRLRPSLLGWRPPLLGWGPLLLGSRLPSLFHHITTWLEAIAVLGWRPPSLLGPSLLGWRPSLLVQAVVAIRLRPSLPEAIATRLEAIAIRLEAIAILYIRFGAIAIGLEATATLKIL